jgi:hypothetical protein
MSRNATLTTLFRKYLACLALLFLAATTSCTNDAEDMGDALYQPPAVEGTYVLTVLQTDDPSTLSKSGESSLNLIEELPCLQVTMQINPDGSLQTTYTDLAVSKDPETGTYNFVCGKERKSSGTWKIIGNALKMDTATFTIYDDKLVDARKPEKELFDLVVFTRLP